MREIGKYWKKLREKEKESKYWCKKKMPKNRDIKYLKDKLTIEIK